MGTGFGVNKAEDRMSRFRFHSTGSGGGGRSKRTLDPTERRAQFGRVLPMDEEPGWLQRLFRRKL